MLLTVPVLASEVRRYCDEHVEEMAIDLKFLDASHCSMRYNELCESFIKSDDDSEDCIEKSSDAMDIRLRHSVRLCFAGVSDVTVYENGISKLLNAVYAMYDAKKSVTK